MITPALGIVAVGVSLAIFAVCSYRRFPPIAEEELQGMRKAGDVGPKPFMALAGFFIWLCLVAFSVRIGPEWMTVLIWAGGPMAAVIWLYRRGSHAQGCEGCRVATQSFRKKHRKSVPALVYVHVCPSCNTYREELVIALASG